MKQILTWALGTGVAISVFQFLLALTGPGHSDLVYNLDLLMLIAGIVFAHRAYRAGRDRGLSYLRALGSGAAVAALAGLVSRGALYLQLRFYDDGLLRLIAEQWRQVLETRGLSPQEVETRLSSMNLTPEGFVQANFLTFLVSGLVLSVIISAFTRQRPRLS